ncbi:MAG TPA: ABC transporter ATP-binding protein [Phycisphaerales bacterium]|nr:ABC transporter ATP-binding protein [Phycisphaerales bacterium]
MPTAIDIQRLVKRYTPGSAPAVDGVSLRVEPGELFFLLGPSGCGKTTLLRMIAGFIDPTEGTISFATGKGETRDVTHLPPNKRNTGMVFQSYALWPHMSVFDNVAFGLTVRKVEKAETQRRVMEALAMVQMDAFAQRKPNALSGGQQQRVALARALVIRPDVLLLDEPLSNLDAKLRIELRSEIRRICKDAGITGVYVTHDQKEALSMADRCAVMRAGRIVQMGTPHELYHKPGSRFVAEFLGETNFIEGTLIDAGAGGARVRTGAGELRSAHAPPAGVGPGSPLALSLRPEALRLTWEGGAGGEGTGNTMSGRVVESTYLGEIAQHTVELGEGGAGAARVKVAQLNPGPTLAAGGSAATVTVAPSDVVLLPV